MIDIKKINVQLPKGVVQQGEISLQGNVAELTVTGVELGEHTITASYDGKMPKTAILKVTTPLELLDFTVVPTENLYCGEKLTVTATFNTEDITAEDLVISAPDTFTVLSGPTITGNTVVVEYSAPVVPEKATITANFRSGTTVKEVVVDVTERPAELLGASTDKDTIRITESTDIVFTFNKQPHLEQLELIESDGLTIGEKVVEGSTIKVTVTGAKAGKHNLRGLYNYVAVDQIINIVTDAVIKTAVASPDAVKVGESSKITVEYDKAIVNGQEPIKIDLGEGVAEKVAYAENETHTGGSLEVTLGQDGPRHITLTLGGQNKVVTITVTQA